MEHPAFAKQSSGSIPALTIVPEEGTGPNVCLFASSGWRRMLLRVSQKLKGSQIPDPGKLSPCPPVFFRDCPRLNRPWQYRWCRGARIACYSPTINFRIELAASRGKRREMKIFKDVSLTKMPSSANAFRISGHQLNPR